MSNRVGVALLLTILTVGCSLGGQHGGGGGGGGTGGGPLTLPPLSSLPASCGSATAGTNYTCLVTASGGTLPYSWTISGLPSGISSSPSQNTMTLTVSGTPTSQDVVGGRATTYTITLCVNDATSAEVCLGTQAQPPQITVNPAVGTLTITTQSPLPYAYVGTEYSTTIGATGGTSPYIYTLSSGSLPQNLSFSSNSQLATISGMPTTAGTYQFTVKVTDSSSPQQTASASFTLTVNSTSTGCSANPGNTLCGLYWFGIRGFNSSNGPTALGGAFSVDSSGNFSGEVSSNDSVTGFAQVTVTSGSLTMDPSGDGRGVVTLNSSSGAIATLRFVLGGIFAIPIEEYETSGSRLGTRAEGFLVGPETAPVPAIAGNTDLAVGLIGANGASQKAGLLGLFTIGANGCDGSNGSFQSLEPFVTNSAGTVQTGLTAIGSCTAPDANGVGTAQFTISGGTPYTINTLQFVYIEAYTSSLQAVLLLEKDAVGANQPLLAGFAKVNTYFGLSFGGLGPLLFDEQGTIDGTVNPHTAIASITRFSPTSGTTGTGTVSGVIDQNAAGTLTTQGTWAYTNYSVDANGVGTLTGAGQKNIDVVLGSTGFLTMDESAEVRTGGFVGQNSTALPAGGVLGSAEGGPTTSGPGDIIGVVGVTGSTAGTFTGTVDLVNNAGAFPGAALSGTYGAPNYISIDPTTGRGTGDVTLTYGNNSSSTNVVIYAARYVVFLVLDMQSTDPDVEVVQ